MKKSYIIGIDEVGRGSLAGPVVVCAAIVPKNLSPKTFNLQPSLRDSKKLTAIQREKWFEVFKNHPHIQYAIAKIHPRKIEKINISNAADLAALRAYIRLTSNLDLRSSNISVFLDGGLYLGNGQNRLPAKTVIKGDEKIPVIAIASIIAKVSRDKIMTRLAKKYPAYNFEIHKGYGTRAHYAALKKLGPSEIHRLTFLS